MVHLWEKFMRITTGDCIISVIAQKLFLLYAINIQHIYRKILISQIPTPLVYLMLKYLVCGGMMCILWTSVETLARWRVRLKVFPSSKPPKWSTAGLACTMSFCVNFEYISEKRKTKKIEYYNHKFTQK